MGSAWVVFWEPHACGSSARGIVWPPEGTCAACIVAAADEPPACVRRGPRATTAHSGSTWKWGRAEAKGSHGADGSFLLYGNRGSVRGG